MSKSSLLDLMNTKVWPKGRLSGSWLATVKNLEKKDVFAIAMGHVQEGLGGVFLNDRDSKSHNLKNKCQNLVKQNLLDSFLINLGYNLKYGNESKKVGPLY
ncbi:hypothetical protein ACJX0J_024904 [Zea mays]